MRCFQQVKIDDVKHDVDFNYERGEPKSFDSPGFPDQFEINSATLDGAEIDLTDDQYGCVIDALIDLKSLEGVI